MDFHTWGETAARCVQALQGVYFNWVQMVVDKYEYFLGNVELGGNNSQHETERGQVQQVHVLCSEDF